MYSEHKYLISSVAIIIFLLARFVFNIQLRDETVQSIITFLSITFGFYMTSLSVLYRSNYSRKLFKRIDPKKQSQREIHTLAKYFKYASYCSIISILLFISLATIELNENILSFFQSLRIKFNRGILIKNIWIKSSLFSLLSINIIFAFLLLKIFINGFFYEASEEENNK